MRTYIVLLAVPLMFWSCRDKNPTTTKPPTTQQTEQEPTVLTDTLDSDFIGDISINAYRWAYYEGQQEDSLSYGLKYVADWNLADAIEGNDMGMPKYNGVPLVRKQQGGDVFYEWPDSSPIPNDKIWNVPAYLVGRAANITDPLPFPEMPFFPDTLYRSSAANAFQISNVGNFIFVAANFDTAYHIDQDFIGKSGSNGVFPLFMILPANEDSVYITVLAQHTVDKYYRMHFTKRASWSKWLRIVD